MQVTHTIQAQLAVKWLGRNMSNAGKLDSLKRSEQAPKRWPRAKPNSQKLVDFRQF